MSSSESSAYAIGQIGGLVLGVLLFGVGAYYLFRRGESLKGNRDN